MQTIDANQTHAILDRWVVGDPMPLVLDLKKSHGAFLHDAKTNQDYLDFFTFFASRALAFAHPKLQDPEYQERLLEAAQIKPSNCDMYSIAYARFVDRMMRGPMYPDFKHLFLIEGGSPAGENAIKAAIDWKVRKNIAAQRGEHGTQIIHFKQCFHGRTGYCLSLTDSYDMRKTQYFPKFKWPRITNPKIEYPVTPESNERVIALEKQALNEIEQALEQNKHDIAAIMIEPIQGEGGDNYFRSEFLQSLRKRCNEHELLLIFDEVQTGFGATAKWWDYQHHHVVPDILVFGKKTQVCGIAATARLDEVDSVFHIKSRISSTFSGGLVDMVRCEKIISIIEEDKLLDNANTMGHHIQHMLNDMADSFPDITAVRGRGLWNAFTLPSTDMRNKVVESCFQEKLLILPCGQHSIRLRPALDVDEDAIRRCSTKLRAALHNVLG